MFRTPTHTNLEVRRSATSRVERSSKLESQADSRVRRGKSKLPGAAVRTLITLCMSYFIGTSAFGHPDVSKPLRIVTFGTSLTARGGWQTSLQAALRECLKRSITIDSVAKSGETTTWALNQTDRVVDLHPDIVLIEIYANDAALDRLISVSASQKNFGMIVDRLRGALPNVRIIDMAMNPIFGIRGAIRPFVSSYIEAHRRETSRRGFEFVDFRADWERLGHDVLSVAIPDGLHPLPETASKVMTPVLVRQISGTDTDCTSTTKKPYFVTPP